MAKQWAFLKDRYYYLTIYIIAMHAVARQYRDSFLGIIWTLLQPASQVVIYALVLPKVMRIPMDNYVVFVACNMLPWAFIMNVMTQTPASLVSRAEILKRCMVSRTIFPIADVVRHGYSFITGFAVMYGVCLLFYIDIHPALFLLPLYVIPVFLILCCAAIALSFLEPFMKDLHDVMAVGMNFVFWLTPVVYPVSSFPEKYQWCFNYNPFYIMIRPLTSITYLQQVPSWSDTSALLIVLGISISVSYGIYRKCRRNFVYYL